MFDEYNRPFRLDASVVHKLVVLFLVNVENGKVIVDAAFDSGNRAPLQYVIIW